MAQPIIPNEPFKLLQRLAGLGTMLLGAFALYYCISFFGDLWNTPQRTISIVVTTASVLLVFTGLVIGFPELLPSKIVALSLFLFGMLSMFVGLAILVWFGYNVFVAWQKEFQIGSPSFAVAMITVGFGIAARGFRKLRERSNR